MIRLGAPSTRLHYYSPLGRRTDREDLKLKQDSTSSQVLATVSEEEIGLHRSFSGSQNVITEENTSNKCWVGVRMIRVARMFGRCQEQTTKRKNRI